MRYASWFSKPVLVRALCALAMLRLALAGVPAHAQEVRAAPGLVIPPAKVAATQFQYRPMVTHTWALLYREFRTEFLGCLYGSVRASRDPAAPDTVTVSYMLLADVKPSHSTDQSVAETSACPPSERLLGMVHSHPGGRSCVHDGRGNCAPLPDRLHGDICFPSRTDSTSFARSGYLIDAIVCGDGQFITITRDFAITRCDFDPEADVPVCRSGPRATAPVPARDELAALP
ncbi:MAG: hypothetical protein ACREAQ_06920 [Nitrososphaera sp.]